MPRKHTVCAVVVTYNRKEYLANTFAALLGQTYLLEGLLVFDNFSTDGTPEMFVEKGWLAQVKEGCLQKSVVRHVPVYYYRNQINSGGSGGFHDAIKMASEMEFDYLWVMDDDVQPDSDCLEKLMKYAEDSCRLCIPNRTDTRYSDRLVTAIDMKNPFKYSISARKTYRLVNSIKGEYATVCDMPFEGPLIAVSLIKQIGLPKKDLFIIFDDTEYAQRALGFTEIRFIKSAILHRQILPVIDRKRLMGWKEYYGYRNQFWFDKTYGENIWVRFLRPVLQMIDLYARAIIRQKWSNIKVVTVAYRDAMCGRMGKTVEPGQMPKWFNNNGQG